MTIELHITMTVKSYSPRAKWAGIGHQREVFTNRTAADTWIDEQYGTSKRTPMYRDVDGKSIQCGVIIGFRNADWSHAPVEKWLQQDWIEYRESRPLALA